jgi:pimeloyl-ACP methyl ester carboxylesterase
MPHLTTDDGVRLHYEETGTGTPIVFVHEFAGEAASWEAQLRHFGRKHRCIAYNARGYPPSDVPAEDRFYSQQRACDDIRAVLDGLGIETAHIVGLSMGGFATVHFGLNHAKRARSLAIAGCGYGAEREKRELFRTESAAIAADIEANGMAAFVAGYGLGASRVQLLAKDPRAWREFMAHFAKHDARGSALTLRNVQGQRPSLYDLADRLAKIAVPTLIVTGDEDFNCLQPSLFLQRVIPSAGLAILPKTGHMVNLEEPAAFNRLVDDFIGLAEAGRWGPRDPRANPNELMRRR